ncbi:MAG: thioredoxin [Bacteroidetes bacterium]|nr:thioredoxin [Bacteroidota bacterium]
MKRIVLMVLSFSTFFVLEAQEKNKIIMDSILQKEVLVGYCTREGLQTGEFAKSYTTEYRYYNPNPKICATLGKYINKYKITVVLGSWCSDTKEQVPRFFKVMDQLKYKERKLTLICVDRAKTARTMDISGLKIEKVPTFIIYKRKCEIGRIIETPLISLEDDLLDIILKSSAKK